jgi:RNA polymerase sigma-70 factor (ECF subfamily)
VVLLEDQDRARWDGEEIAEGLRLVAEAFSPGRSGPYVLQAAIAAQHSVAATWAETDWSSIVDQYDQLVPLTGSPVVALNRAVAVGQLHGSSAALDALEAIGGDLDGYHPFHTSRGELLRRVGRETEARAEFERALQLTGNEAERRLLLERIGTVR